MGGGTLQLVIYGGQDIHITGNPQFSYFKSVYRRHTNFSMECIEQTVNTVPSSTSFKLDYEIVKSGDLLNKMHIEIDLPEQDIKNGGSGDGSDYLSYVNNTAFSYIKDIELYIGEKLIDKHNGKWYDILNVLDHKDGSGIDYIVNRLSAGIPETNDQPARTKLYIPLHFWFCKDISQSLPLIALQYHKVRLILNFRSIKGIINRKPIGVVTGADKDIPKSPTIKLWGNYILLDKDERKRFSQSHHEYLIEQLQIVEKRYRPVIDIKLNHPVKCLYWTIQSDIVNVENETYSDINSKDNIEPLSINSGRKTWANSNDYLNYKTELIDNPSYIRGLTFDHFKEATIMFNGIERFKPREASYFRTIQPLEHGYTFPEKFIYMYSFSLYPKENHPSGSCNFSRIDNTTFNFTGTQTYTGYNFTLYATNYNVLRIMEGLGGLLYSN